MIGVKVIEVEIEIEVGIEALEEGVQDRGHVIGGEDLEVEKEEGEGQDRDQDREKDGDLDQEIGREDTVDHVQGPKKNPEV